MLLDQFLSPQQAIRAALSIELKAQNVYKQYFTFTLRECGKMKRHHFVISSQTYNICNTVIIATLWAVKFAINLEHFLN